MAFGHPFPRARGAVSRAARVRWTAGAPALPKAGRMARAPVVKLCPLPRPVVG